MTSLSLAVLMELFMCGKWKPVTWTEFCMVKQFIFFLIKSAKSDYSPFKIGMLAEEVLSACDENATDASPHGSTSEMGLANPAVHFFRGLRHRNLNAIRHATQRGINQLQQLHAHNNSDNIFLLKNRSSPLTIQGLRTNPKGKFKLNINREEKNVIKYEKSNHF